MPTRPSLKQLAGTLLGLVAFAPSCPTAAAQSGVDVEGWRLEIHDDQCELGRGFDDGTLLVLRHDPLHAAVRVTVASRRFASVGEGEPYILKVLFYRGSTVDEGWEPVEYRGHVGSRIRSVGGVYGEQILGDFAGNDGVRFQRESTVVATLSLEGAPAAIRALKQCSDRLLRGLSPDPFAKPGR